MLFNIEVKQHRQVVPIATDVETHRMAETIRDRWKKARERAGLGFNELDRLIGQGSGYSSPLESGGKKLTTAEIMGKAAKALNVNVEWLITGEGPMDRAAPDPTIGQFLIDMRRLPELEAWIAKKSGDYTVSQVAKVMKVYEASSPSARGSDGVPHGGWDAYFSAALSGKLSKVRPGAGNEVEDAERAQMSKAAQKRLPPTSKK